ncbi:MAG TPA: multicopper oxidase domain-containing protein [Ilumatobacter sp.]|nr:multicopper oxidase domain-containing protein [Ilumatobacter sp.]
MTITRLHDDTFATATAGLPVRAPTPMVELRNGDTCDLRIAPVANKIGDSHVRMLGFNGSVPGPTLRVARGAEIAVRVRNDGDHETTVHWHGLRVDNAYDGVPHETQDPIPVGGEFTYRLRFPDDGVYWYHPHVREDYGLEMGLYGNIIVDPTNSESWPSVNREAVVTLDDILIEHGRVASFRVSGPTHTAMGRFGNVMFTGGATELTLNARVGEVVRFFLTNTANTRIFSVAIAGARMKMVAGDNGRYEREEWVEAVLVAPSERAVVDVAFPQPGSFPIEHRTPTRTYRLGSVEVDNGAVDDTFLDEFETLHTNPGLESERARLEDERRRPADKTLVFTASMPILYNKQTASASSFVCPMHAEVTSTEPGTCPKCGMKLIAVEMPTMFVCPMHAEVTSTEPGTCPKCGMKLTASDPAPVATDGHGQHKAGEHHNDPHDHDTGDGLEWEDLMPDINARTDATNMIWKIVDAGTGAENTDIDWKFTVGDRLKIRLINTMDSDHPMHHPFHVHGAGRFLVLERDGEPTANLVWKDSVLVRAGETVDIMLELTEPGVWMAHCHIAEHNQDGMMFNFQVESK